MTRSGASPASHVLLVPLLVHTMKGLSNQVLPFHIRCRESVALPSYSLRLESLHPTPTVSLETCISLKQSKIGLPNWVPTLLLTFPAGNLV